MPDRSRTALISGPEVRALIEALQEDQPMTIELMDGSKIELTAGDSMTGQMGQEFASLEDLPTPG